MTAKLQIYKCNVCGNIVQVMHAGAGNLVCCGQPMQRLEENAVDAAKEKHVPVIEKTEKGVKVKVGSVPHPMEEKHYIEWIQVGSGEGGCGRFLKPGDAPEADFACTGESVGARAYCNLHGLWKS